MRKQWWLLLFIILVAGYVGLAVGFAVGKHRIISKAISGGYAEYSCNPVTGQIYLRWKMEIVPAEEQ